jgi:uncharacterized protein YjdB
MRKQLIGVLTLVALLFLWVPTARMAASDYAISVVISKTGVSVSAVNAKLAIGDTVSIDLYDSNDSWLLNRTATVQTKGKVSFIALKLASGTYKVRVSKGVELSDDYADQTFTVGTSTSPTPTPIAATGLKIVTKSSRFKVNQVVPLQVTAVPTGAAIQNVHWFSSDEAVATIDPYTGVLTAKAPGTSYVIVTNDDGSLVDGRSMLVYAPLRKVTLNKSTLTIRRKKSTTLILSAVPSSASLPQMTWTSNEAKHKVVKWVSVNSSVLKITGVSVGTVTLKGKSADGKYRVSCKITVKK